MELTDYEWNVREQIEIWRNRKPDLISVALNAIAQPLGWLASRAVPIAAQQAAERAVLGFLEMMKDASYWTYSDAAILARAKKLGIAAETLADLQTAELPLLDKLARKHFTQNKLASALEGAGCGLGGLALIAADIPALFAVSLRAAQQIGASYGFDMKDPDLRPIVYHVFNAGVAASSAAKSAALADMRIAALAFAKNWTYKEVAEKTQTGVVAKLLKEATKTLPRKIADNVTKRKLAQIVPIVGSAVGAGFNYWFLANITESAFMLFRELYLDRKEAASGPAPTSE